MLTAKEYRSEAEACLKLAMQANDLYVKVALEELARDYSCAARQVERRERDRGTFAAPNFQATTESLKSAGRLR
jgi:hypothetical protein